METDLQVLEYNPIKIFWIIGLKTVYTLHKDFLYTMEYNVDIGILKTIRFNLIYVYWVIYNLWMTSSWSIVKKNRKQLWRSILHMVYIQSRIELFRRFQMIP